jgi:hypothetical protein
LKGWFRKRCWFNSYQLWIGFKCDWWKFFPWWKLYNFRNANETEISIFLIYYIQYMHSWNISKTELARENFQSPFFQAFQWEGVILFLNLSVVISLQYLTRQERIRVRFDFLHHNDLLIVIIRVTFVGPYVAHDRTRLLSQVSNFPLNFLTCHLT